MKNILFALVGLLFIASFSSHAQVGLSNEVPFRVDKIYPSISMTKNELGAAKTISDINPFYKSSWIKEFKTIETTAWNNGVEKKVITYDNNLSPEQKELINLADVKSEIAVVINYIPDNTLKNNGVKVIDFVLTIEPELDAIYTDGQAALEKYLKENAIDKIPAGAIDGYRIAAIKFIIDEEGQIIDPEIAWSSENSAVDTLLYETICNMPNWQPASYADGTKVKQEFALSIGNEESCAMYVLNTRKKRLEPED